MKSDIEILVLVGVALFAAVMLVQMANGPASVEMAVEPVLSALPAAA